MQCCEDLETLVADADVLLSILPPAAAIGFAEQVCPLIKASGNDLLFVDCNAVSPASLERIANIAARNGVRFQDVGIVGAAPRPGRIPVRFYTSGQHLESMRKLRTDLIDIKPLGDEAGRASALKMVFASLTKGTHALQTAAMMAGEALGVGAEIREEWRNNLPQAYQAMPSSTWTPVRHG